MNYNKLLMAFIIGMFLISFTSAGLLQRNLKFNKISKLPQQAKAYGQYELHENGFLGLLRGGTIQTYTLLNSENSVINAQATLEVTNYRPEKLLDKMIFKGGTLRDLRLTYLVNESYTVPTYKQVCHKNINHKFGTRRRITNSPNSTNTTSQICKQVKTGTVTKYKQIWKDYNKQILPKGTYQLKIQGKLPKVNNAVDWVLNKNGEKLDKWQWWDSQWDYKREIDLTANAGQFSYLATINYDPHMNSDFSDIRFVNGAEDTEFKYTIEKKTDGVSATVRIYSQGETTFYMYYGNSGATTTSSASDTYFSPVSMYYLDGNTNDAVGSNDGTNNGATPTTGKIGGAYDFNNDYIDISPISSSNSDFTASVWFYENSNSNTLNGALSFGQNTGVSYEKMFSINSQRIYFRYKSGSGHEELDYSLSGNLNQWYHVVITKSGNTLTFYVNGNQVATKTDSDIGSMGFFNWHYKNIGKAEWNDNGGNKNFYFDGIVDEVGIWDKALTSTQISDLYQQTAPTYTVGSEESNSKYFNKYSHAEILIAGNKITKLGTGRIKIDDLQQVYDGSGRLKVNSEITKEGQSRINLSSVFTKNSNAKIFKREKIEKTGNSSIRILGLSFNKEGNAFISNRSTFEKTGNSKIFLFGRQFLKDSQTRIQIKNLSFTKEGKSRILKGYSFEKTGTSEVVLRQTIEKIGKSYVVMLDKYQPKIKSINYLPPKIKSIETFN